MFLIHDLGTTGSKGVLFDERGAIVASAEEHYPTAAMPGGGFEQNPADWLSAIASSTRRLMEQSRSDVSDVRGISVSGHMMGVVALDSEWRPVRPAILHSDTRSHPQVQEIRERMAPTRIFQIGGNPLDVHYPWAKIAWLRDKEPGSYSSSAVFVQSKDYVTSWLTGRSPVTEWSDASLYGCFDFRTMRWSKDLADAAGIDYSRLPDIADSGSQAGKLASAPASLLGLPDGIPVYVGLGDGAAAALGSGSWQPGSFYNYVGSTSWVAGTTAAPVIDPEGRLFTLAITKDLFSTIGTVQCAGAAWDWAVTRLLQYHFETAESLAAASPVGSRGLLFLPYLSGERAPVWNDRARGVWFGLSTEHCGGDLLRSVLEGVSLALARIGDDVRRCMGRQPSSIRIIGGGMRNRLWRDILISAHAVTALCMKGAGEATARGAFFAAARGAGLIRTFDECSSLMPDVERVEPVPELIATYRSMSPLFAKLYSVLESSFDDLCAVREQHTDQEAEDAAF